MKGNFIQRTLCLTLGMLCIGASAFAQQPGGGSSRAVDANNPQVKARVESAQKAGIQPSQQGNHTPTISTAQKAQSEQAVQARVSKGNYEAASNVGKPSTPTISATEKAKSDEAVRVRLSGGNYENSPSVSKPHTPTITPAQKSESERMVQQRLATQPQQPAAGSVPVNKVHVISPEQQAQSERLVREREQQMKAKSQN